MKKIVLVLSIMAIVVLGATACSEKEKSKSASGVEVINKGKLTVCSDVPYAPFEFEKDGKYVGIDIDLVTAIADKLELDISIQDTDFDAIFAALKSEKCDMIASSVSITDERKKSNNFSDPYYQITQSILVRTEDKNDITDLDELDGKTVGVQSETTGEAFAQEKASANGFTVKSFTGADEMVAALKGDTIDAVIQDYPINAYDAKVSGKTVVTKKFEGNESYGFVIPKSNTKLQSAVNDALSELKDDGKYDDIVSMYLGS